MRIKLVGFVLVLLAVSFLLVTFQDTAKRLTVLCDRLDVALSHAVVGDRAMPVLETSWTSAGPLQHKVSTPRNTGESADAHAARHQTNVAALKDLYPPIG